MLFFFDSFSLKYRGRKYFKDLFFYSFKFHYFFLSLIQNRKLGQVQDFLGIPWDFRTAGPVSLPIFLNLRKPNQRRALPVHRDIILLQRIDAKIEDYENNMNSIPIMTKLNGGRVMTNPLSWWKNKQRQLPLMSDLARRILCIPATSAPSERVFSPLV